MHSESKRVVLFANGDFLAPERLVSQLTNKDFLIAVDGGLKHLTQYHLVPNLVIGDLDSANPVDVQYYQSQGVEIRKYPVEKDQTDLELALEAAQEVNPALIWVVAALGNRLDQTLANIYLLTQPKFSDLNIRLIDGLREVFLIRGQGSLQGCAEDRVSLVPISRRVTGIKTTGLYFPLIDETLVRHQTRGISNRMTSSSAEITLKNGLLLCIHEISNQPELCGEND